MSRASIGLEEDDIESPAETHAKTDIEYAKHEEGDQGIHVQWVSVVQVQSFTMLYQSVDAPRCPSFNHTTASAVPMSHNLTSVSVVDAAGRVMRKWQGDVDRCEFEGFKELFQVFSLTQRHVTPDVPRCHTVSPTTHPVSGRSCASAPTEICSIPLFLSTEYLSVRVCLCSSFVYNTKPEYNNIHWMEKSSIFFVESASFLVSPPQKNGLSP
jgi:hypothetical protein